MTMSGREQAYLILMEFEKSHDRISSILENQLEKKSLSDRDKKFSYNLVYGVLRHRSMLDWQAGMFFNGNYKKAVNMLKNILRLALYEINHLDHIPPHATVNEYVNLTRKKLPRQYTGIVNGILRSFLREGQHLKPEKKFKYPETRIAVTYSLPEWLTKRWISAWGEEKTTEIARSFSERPVFDIRIDTGKIPVSDLRQLLQNEGIFFAESAYFKDVLKIWDVQGLIRLGLFANGICRVQDESGRLAVELLEPQNDDTVLDACAAPGGKLLSIFQKWPKTVLVGMELFADRMRILKMNCKDWQVDPHRLVQADGLHMPYKYGCFTKILLDVPCSGLGTLQKHPDIKWRRSESEIEELSRLQLGLLESAAEMLAPAGAIVYSTCTIDPRENDEVVERFLSNKGKKFKPQKTGNEILQPFWDGDAIRTFPHMHQMDGSFAIRLQNGG